MKDTKMHTVYTSHTLMKDYRNCMVKGACGCASNDLSLLELSCTMCSMMCKYVCVVELIGV